MGGPRDRRKQKGQEAGWTRFPLSVDSRRISESEPPPSLWAPRLVYKRRVAALFPFLFFPQYHHNHQR